jgi:signal transduction histidine kinase
MSGVSHLGFAWPLAASMAIVLTAQLRAGRRRSAINEALHELRRPLQAIALSGSGGRPGVALGVESSIELAAAALERLDREINGGPIAAVRATVRPHSLLQAAVGRWKARAALSGCSLELRWLAGDPVLRGDRSGLSQALDNLIVNAIEHGGPSIVVEARQLRGRLRVSVADSGFASRPRERRDSPAAVIARLSGRNRRGHGLPVVRRVAADHDGRFLLRHSERGSLAVLELPLAADGAKRVA